MAYKPKVLTVSEGGTGQATLTNHGVLIGAGTTAVTQLGAGSAGQILQSGGASADPTYSTATFPTTATGTGKVLIADGTNWVASTPTFPNASATSGKFIRSDGTNWIASTPTLPTAAGTSGKVLQSNGTNYIESTPTYPSASGTTGTILRSDGTNNAYTTSTYPNTNAVNTLLYASSANIMGALATANSRMLTTDSSGVPSWGKDYIESSFTPTLVGASTAGSTTYVSQGGYYTKIGNTVFIQLNITISAATGTGDLLISNLPYTVKQNTASNYTCAPIYFSGATWAWNPVGATSLCLLPYVNTTTAKVFCSGASTAGGNMQMTNGALTIYSFIMYQV